MSANEFIESYFIIGAMICSLMCWLGGIRVHKRHKELEAYERELHELELYLDKKTMKLEIQSAEIAKYQNMVDFLSK